MPAAVVFPPSLSLSLTLSLSLSLSDYPSLSLSDSFSHLTVALPPSFPPFPSVSLCLSPSHPWSLSHSLPLCAGSTSHTKAQCTKLGAQCDLCGKIGHLKAKCRQQLY